MKFNCLICGVGGQGTVLASRVVAHTAMQKGFSVRTAETIGMAQRGGSVVSHVRVGDYLSPMIAPGEADMLIGLEPGEAVRQSAFLREGGAIVVLDEVIAPVTASLLEGEYSADHMLKALEGLGGRLFVVSAEKARGTDRARNITVLGAAAAIGALPFSLADIEASLRETIHPKYLDINLRALHIGSELAKG